MQDDETDMRISGPDEFVVLLRQAMESSDLPETVTEAAARYAENELAPDAVPGGLQATFRFPFQEGGYVVKRDDVDLLAESIEFAFAASQVALGLAAPLALAPLAVIAVVHSEFTTFRVLDRLRRKVASVTRDQYAVISALKAIEKPATLKQLTKVLGARADGMKVDAVLRELASLRSRDGTVTGFVCHDHGKWSVAGL